VNFSNQSLLKQKTFSVYDSTSTHGTLLQLCRNLLDQQKLRWPQLTEGYAALESVQFREIVCNNFSVTVQFNPRRIRSTGADLDAKTIRERTCFLCLEHLPASQQGILYRNEFFLLCNPAPIFSRHLTFSSVHHIPQALELSLDILLDLARDLHPDFTVFYNGPKSGASAPDHLHFQVSPWRAIPIELDAVDMRRRKRMYYKDHVSGSILMNYGRTALVIESTEKNQLLKFLKNILREWKNVLDSSEEPKLNVLCSYQEELWRLIFLPRRKHRPDIFFAEGEARILISPAAVDMGGFIVTPMEKDYKRADARLIEDIFAEVTEPQNVVETIIKTLL
jgi:hypothetical protein